MTEPWTVLIALHAAGATLALLLGGWLLARRRKGDRLHRRVGRAWAVTMVWVAGSSFGIRRLNPGHFSWIHLLSAWTLVSLTFAVAAARRHDRRAHRGWVVGTYLGLVGAGLGAVAVPQRLVPQTVVHHPWWLLLAVVALAATAAAVVAALARLGSSRARYDGMVGRRPRRAGPADARGVLRRAARLAGRAVGAAVGGGRA